MDIWLSCRIMMTPSNGNISTILSFVRGIHRSPVNFPHKGQWRGDLMFSLTCAWVNGWVNNRDLRHHRAHYDVIVMVTLLWAAAASKTSIVTAAIFQKNNSSHCNTFGKSDGVCSNRIVPNVFMECLIFYLCLTNSAQRKKSKLQSVFHIYRNLKNINRHVSKKI